MCFLIFREEQQQETKTQKWNRVLKRGKKKKTYAPQRRNSCEGSDKNTTVFKNIFQRLIVAWITAFFLNPLWSERRNSYFWLPQMDYKNVLRSYRYLVTHCGRRWHHILRTNLSCNKGKKISKQWSGQNISPSPFQRASEAKPVWLLCCLLNSATRAR